jgi:cell division septum initiation protein DivIVA
MLNSPSASAFDLSTPCVKATIVSTYPLPTPTQSATPKYEINYVNTCNKEISSIEIGISKSLGYGGGFLSLGGAVRNVKAYAYGSVTVTLSYAAFQSSKILNFAVKESTATGSTSTETAVEFGAASVASAIPEATTAVPNSGIAASSGDNYTQNLNGLIFTWPKQVYAPQSAEESKNAKIVMNFDNQSGKDLYYIGWTLKTIKDDFVANFKQPPVFAMKLAVKNGTKGTIETDLIYTYFLNVTGPVSYTMNLCKTVSLLESETCVDSAFPLTFVTTKPGPSAASAAASAAAEKVIADANAQAAKIISDAKAAADKATVANKTTITCVKGKVSKKVTAVNPKCPVGYKKK